MLIENHKKHESTLQLNTATLSPTPPHKTITTIAELRASYIARSASTRRQHAVARAVRIRARWEHAQVIHELLERLSTVYNVPNLLSPTDVFAIYEGNKWSCSFTGQWHNAETPLSVHFIKPLDRYGIISLSNVKPRYYAGLLAGEYHIVRNTIEFRPPVIAPVALAMGA